MLTFHGNTTSFITQYTLKMVDNNSKNFRTSSQQLSAVGQLQIKLSLPVFWIQSSYGYL